MLLTCLSLLVSCSTDVQHLAKPDPLHCPLRNDCRLPSFEIKTNKNLVGTLEKSLNTIEVCQLIIESQQHCIDAYNKSIQK
ncbi:Rz1-like lysis system protein LysC [Actinobacillus lignieresii]|uniref:Rz1-like lysis system protein LysC n=1 Tax=Actinobacillus lignieresii TaxID=720 RepID=UPI0035ABD979